MDSIQEKATQPLSDSAVCFAQQLLSKPANVVKSVFVHKWYDSSTQEITLWHGEVIKKKRKKDTEFNVEYYRVDEDPSTSSVHPISAVVLLTDLLVGDLCML